jgi:hypothetical protein
VDRYGIGAACEAVPEEKSACKRLPLSGDQFDRLRRFDGADNAAGCPDDREHLPWRALGEEAAQAGGLSGDHGCRLAEKPPHGAVDERDALSDRRPVQEVTGRKIVHRIDNDVAIPGHLPHALLRNPAGDGFQVDQGVQGAELLLDRGGFQPSNVSAPVEDLAVQVALLDNIAVDDPQMAHTGGGQIEGDHRSKSSGAGDEDARRLETFLARFSDHQDLADISFPFLIRDHGFSRSPAHACPTVIFSIKARIAIFI